MLNINIWEVSKVFIRIAFFALFFCQLYFIGKKLIECEKIMKINDQKMGKLKLPVFTICPFHGFKTNKVAKNFEEYKNQTYGIPIHENYIGAVHKRRHQSRGA